MSLHLPPVFRSHFDALPPLSANVIIECPQAWNDRVGVWEKYSTNFLRHIFEVQNLAQIKSKQGLINLFVAQVPTLYPLETTEKLRFSGVFRGYKSGSIGQKYVMKIYLQT